MAFPSNGILDNFNRANIDPADGNISYPIFPAGGAPEILSNALGNRGGSTSYWNGAFAADQEVYCTMVALPGLGTGGIGVFGRIQTPNTVGIDCYFVTFYRDSTPSEIMRFAKFINNAGALIDDVDVSGYGFAAGDGIGMSIIGSQITGYWNDVGGGGWTAIATRTDTDITAGGFIGLGDQGNNVGYLLDNLGGGNVTVLAPTLHRLATPARW